MNEGDSIIVANDLGITIQSFSELAYKHATDSMIRIVRSQEEASPWFHD